MYVRQFWFFLSGVEPLALFFLRFFVSQSGLLMNEVYLPAEVADERRLKVINLLKNTNVNVIYVGFVVHLG